MTICIALQCSDGLIIGADSQSTEETGGVRWQTDKLFQLTDRFVAAGSGSVTILDDIKGTLRASQAMLDATPRMGNTLADLTHPVLVAHYRRFIAQVPGMAPASPATSLLVAGYEVDGTPRILELDPRCTVTDYTEARGFHAIGSGAGFAQMAAALMAHFDIRQRPMRYGKIVAHWVLDAVIDTLAATVGRPVRMWTIEPGQAPHELTQDEVDQIEADVGAWKTRQAEDLERFLTPAVTEAEAGELPPPAE